MISLLRKKHPTTQPNTIALISLERFTSLRPLALLCAGCLLWSASFSSPAECAELKWGRPTKTRPLAKSTTLQFRQASPRHTVARQVTRDTNITTVAWEDESASTNARSIVVERSETSEPLSEPLYVAQQLESDIENDPFALEIEDELLPEFDEEAALEDAVEEPTEQIEQEPTLEELLDELPEPTDPIEESTDESITDEPSEEMTEEEFQDDLFGTDEAEPADETEAEEATEAEESDTAAEQEEAPESKESTDDPFDEPSVDQLPTESVDNSLDKEIKRRMDALDSKTSEEPIEKKPLDALNTTNLFDDQLEDDSTSDTDSSKLFDDAGNLDIEIGGPIGTNELTEAERNQQLQQLDKERQEGQKNCEDEFAKMKSDLIDDIDLSLRVDGNPGEDFPYECNIGHGKHQPRQWAQITYNWKASGLCHKPLYFEQVQLERYGHSWGPYVQPIMSGVHFFGTVPILPYKMGIRTPTECVYTLGYYRPGSCAPYLVGGVPFTWRAALFQGGVATGLPFAIP